MYIYPFNLTWNLREKKDFDLYPCPLQSRHTVVFNRPRFNTGRLWLHSSEIAWRQARSPRKGKDFPHLPYLNAMSCAWSPFPKTTSLPLAKALRLDDHQLASTSCKELHFAVWFHILLKTLHHLAHPSTGRFEGKIDKAAIQLLTDSRPHCLHQ